MVMRGECVQTGAPTACLDCHKELKPQVLRSNGGWYIGYRCPDCGPHTRESAYYRNEKEAQEAFESGNYGRE